MAEYNGKKVEFTLVAEFREDGTTDIRLDNPDNIPESLVAEALFNMSLWYNTKLAEEAQGEVGDNKLTQQQYLVGRTKVDQKKLKQIIKDKT